MAMLPLKSSRNEQRAVILFLWAKGLNANEIHCEMRLVYGDKRPGRHVVATTDATIAAVDAFVRSDGTDV